MKSREVVSLEKLDSDQIEFTVRFIEADDEDLSIRVLLDSTCRQYPIPKQYKRKASASLPTTKVWCFF